MNAEYLIINLRRFGDILTSAHLISVLKQREPLCKVSLLVYEESRRAAHVLGDVEKVYTLDRKKILSLSKNRIFSPALALNALSGTLGEIEKTAWTKIINTSNDKVSAALVSYLSLGREEAFAGIRFNENFNTESSGPWASVFNDVVTSYKHTPVHFVDCFLGMAGVLQKEIPFAKLKVNSEYEKTARENFKLIKEQLGKDVQIVGIQLKASLVTKDIPLNALVDFLGFLLDEPRFYPVLLIAPFEEERAYANELNALFQQSLIVIEADFIAMNSVLKNLNVLVTPDTVIKHQAELAGTPLVEVSLGPAPFLRQGPVREGNLVLTPTLKQRTWFEKTDGAFEACLSGADLIAALELRLGLVKVEELQGLSPQMSLYQSTRTEKGTEYKILTGERHPLDELTRKVARAYLFALLGEDFCFNFENELSVLSTTLVEEWISSQRIQLSQFTAEELNAFCASEKLTALAFLFFRAGLEQSSTQEDLEKHGKNLRKNMELLFAALSSIEKQIKGRKGYSSFVTTDGNNGTDTN